MACSVAARFDHTYLSQFLKKFTVLLALIKDGRVYLRRDVSIIDEDGIIYAIEICIRDLTHTLQPEICGRLNVTFVSKYKISKQHIFMGNTGPCTDYVLSDLKKRAVY